MEGEECRTYDFQNRKIWNCPEGHLHATFWGDGLPQIYSSSLVSCLFYRSSFSYLRPSHRCANRMNSVLLERRKWRRIRNLCWEAGEELDYHARIKNPCCTYVVVRAKEADSITISIAELLPKGEYCIRILRHIQRKREEKPERERVREAGRERVRSLFEGEKQEKRVTSIERQETARRYHARIDNITSRLRLFSYL